MCIKSKLCTLDCIWTIIYPFDPRSPNNNLPSDIEVIFEQFRGSIGRTSAKCVKMLITLLHYRTETKVTDLAMCPGEKYVLCFYVTVNDVVLVL